MFYIYVIHSKVYQYLKFLSYRVGGQTWGLDDDLHRPDIIKNVVKFFILFLFLQIKKTHVRVQCYTTETKVYVFLLKFYFVPEVYLSKCTIIHTLVCLILFMIVGFVQNYIGHVCENFLLFLLFPLSDTFGIRGTKAFSWFVVFLRCAFSITQWPILHIRVAPGLMSNHKTFYSV